MLKRSVRGAVSAVAVMAVVVVAVTGCGDTEGTPTAESGAADSATASAAPRTATPTPSTAVTPPSTAGPTPSGQPIGTATMKVTGSDRATISYQINGGARQVEPDATLPWEKQYPVYDKIPSSVTVDGGAAELTCSIIMDGQLAAFKTEPNPTCSFAYY